MLIESNLNLTFLLSCVSDLCLLLPCNFFLMDVKKNDATYKCQLIKMMLKIVRQMICAMSNKKI